MTDEPPAATYPHPAYPDGPAVPVAPPAPPPRRRLWVAVWWPVSILATAALSVAATLAVTGQLHLPKPGPDASTLAIRACEEAVKQQLKAPATARFSHETARQDDTLYRVAGDVDAENGFSALIRGHFTCTASGQGSDWYGSSVELTTG